MCWMCLKQVKYDDPNVTKLWGLLSGRGRNFSLHHHVQTGTEEGSASILLHGYWQHLPWGQSGQLVPRVRMHRTIPPLPPYAFIVLYLIMIGICLHDMVLNSAKGQLYFIISWHNKPLKFHVHKRSVPIHSLKPSVWPELSTFYNSQICWRSYSKHQTL
jgi:hypothetical protein